MKKATFLTYFLLLTFTLQNGIVLSDLVEDCLGSNAIVSIILKKSEKCKAEEDNEENEKEASEKEGKEKEVNRYQLNNPSTRTSLLVMQLAYINGDSKIFPQYFETETPPPEKLA